MNDSKILLKTAFAGVIALGSTISETAYAMPGSPTAWEKCAGISKAGLNDCGALDGKHQCAKQSTTSNSPNEWVYVPLGTCTKISGGVVAMVKQVK